MQNRKNYELFISLIGGRIHAFRCQALSKRSKQQCRKAALKGKRVCMFHGGKSTGPMTSRGKQRCAKARTIHGRETRLIRNKRAKKLTELKYLVSLLSQP